MGPVVSSERITSRKGRRNTLGSISDSSVKIKIILKRHDIRLDSLGFVFSLSTYSKLHLRAERPAIAWFQQASGKVRVPFKHTYTRTYF